ncbi:MAG: Fe3+ citrate-binding protein, partial [Corynebacterium sp.]|nr:Fe3+ citrate-binding protein [Corynebacterium sp.]MDN6352824.1 Fe3+ citrate-binding protein [Corynebacterium sp.]
MTFTRFPIPCRTVLAGVTAALLSTTVACGSDDGNDSADGGDTTTFSYGGVTVDIPTDPQRVVCIETRLCPEFAEITGMNLVATP